MDPFLGEIRMFAFGITPRGWLPCNGQVLSIQTNQALFALLGIFYGGDGQRTFALPNLQAQTPTGYGVLPATGETFQIGQVGGAASVALLTSQIPAHNHQVTAARSANSTDPAGGFLAGPTKPAFTTAGATTTMGVEALSFVGSGLPHENMPPFTVMNFCIATQGIFPSRS